MNMRKSRKILFFISYLGLLSVLQTPWFRNGIAHAVATVLAEEELLGAPECTLTADEAYAQSVELLSDGKQSEAEDVVDSALKRYRDDKRLVFAKAVLRRSRWFKNEAAVWFFRCSKNSDYLGRSAELAVALDRHENVAANMADLIQRSDDHPDDIYLLWLSAIQCREHDMGAAGKERYELLLGKFRTGPIMAHHTYANILTEDLHDYETALKHRKIVLSMTSRDWALQGMANTLTDSGDNIDALPMWEKLVEIKPSDYSYWHRYASVLERLGRLSEAVHVFKKTIKLYPSDEYTWRHLGLCLSMLGNHEEAFECYRQAMELEGDVNPAMMDGYLVENNSYSESRARQLVMNCYLLGRGVKKNSELASRYCDDTGKYVERLLHMAEELAEMDIGSHRAGIIQFADGTKLMTTCNVLDVMVAICESAGRIDLAVATQQRLVTRCQSTNIDQVVRSVQRERLTRLIQLQP
jgi:tetratricopeptide (TPR) repeat protein